MPVVALTLFAVFAALGFGWRSWEQRRRTGSTGFRGVSGRLGSAEWFAGVGFVVALVAAVTAPLLQLAGVVSPLDVLHAPWIQAAGITVAAAGITVAAAGIATTVHAQLDMGDSWRIGVDLSETTMLVRTGVFGWVRNPIFTAMMTSGLGIALVTSNLVALVGFGRALCPRGWTHAVGGLTLTNVLPTLAPVNSPLRASTHDSMPSKMVWRCTSRPSASHWRRWAKASSKRPHSSRALNPCMRAVFDNRLT